MWRRRHFHSRRTAGAALAIVMAVAAVGAELSGTNSYDMSWSTVDDGGAVSIGGGPDVIEFTATIGQPDAFAAGPMAGGDYEFSPGFWHGVTPTVATCPADITNDGLVNVNDLLAVINNWGPCAGCPADITNDGLVNVNDLLQVLNNWGLCPEG